MDSLRNQQGLALPLALMALLALGAFLMVFLALGSGETMIGRGHTEATEARYVAESGIEWAYDLLARTSDWNTLLLGPDGVAGTADDGQPSPPLPLPGLTAASGTFTVTFRNDSQPGDNQITGVPLDPGGSFSDTNSRLVVTSVGVVGAATRTVRVVARRIALPPVAGPIGLPGTESETTFNGNSFTISGNDINLDDTLGTGGRVFGIAVGSAANEQVVQNSLSKEQKDNVLGQPQDPTGPPFGDNTIAADARLNPGMFADFLAAVRPQADLSFRSTAATPLSFSSLGASCATDPNSTTCWGTREKPKIVSVKADLDPTASFTALHISGESRGAGIMIVEDGDLRISGNFRWEGLIVVTGQYVGIAYVGAGWQTVYGAVYSNETGSDPGIREALIAGNAKMLYSTQGLNVARQMRKLLVLSSWQEL